MMNKYQDALNSLNPNYIGEQEYSWRKATELLQELVDKETSMIPIEIESDDPCYCNIDYFCPKCREQVYEEDNKYCNKCGQKLEWGE